MYTNAQVRLCLILNNRKPTQSRESKIEPLNGPKPPYRCSCLQLNHIISQEPNSIASIYFAFFKLQQTDCAHVRIRAVHVSVFEILCRNMRIFYAQTNAYTHAFERLFAQNPCKHLKKIADSVQNGSYVVASHFICFK